MAKRLIHDMKLNTIRGDGAQEWECPTCGLVLLHKKGHGPVILRSPSEIDPEIDHVTVRDWLKPFQDWIEKLP